jgi:hypothetical protein
MEIRSVDPRDINWEADYPVFRVYLWDVAARQSYEHEITGADVDEVLAWAHENTKPGWTHTVYVFIQASADRGPGLVRISGVVGDPFPAVPGVDEEATSGHLLPDRGDDC